MPEPRKLPVVSGREVIKAPTRSGFEPVRQRGSHVFLRHPDGRRTVIPLHDEINRSTLMDIIDQVGWTRDEFLKALKR